MQCLHLHVVWSCRPTSLVRDDDWARSHPLVWASRSRFSGVGLILRPLLAPPTEERLGLVLLWQRSLVLRRQIKWSIQIEPDRRHWLHSFWWLGCWLDLFLPRMFDLDPKALAVGSSSQFYFYHCCPSGCLRFDCASENCWGLELVVLVVVLLHAWRCTQSCPLPFFPESIMHLNFYCLPSHFYHMCDVAPLLLVRHFTDIVVFACYCWPSWDRSLVNGTLEGGWCLRWKTTMQRRLWFKNRYRTASGYIGDLKCCLETRSL